MSDMALQRSAAARARLLRAEYLHAVDAGTLGPLDVIDEAREDYLLPLRQISLRGLFVDAGFNNKQWRDVRSRLLNALAIDVEDRKLTVGWVLDPRAGGRRIYALVDALRDRDEPPWPGFPWTPRSPGVASPAGA